VSNIQNYSYHKEVPSNLLFSSRGHNFVTPAATFCVFKCQVYFIKKFQNHTLLSIIFSFDVVLGQEVVQIVEFCDEINCEKLKKAPRKHKKEVDFRGYFNEKII